MRSGAWLVRAVAWDGVIPVAVALVPILIREAFRLDRAVAAFLAFFVPIFAAMVRAGIGQRQIERVCRGEVPVLRQLGLAGAIVLLLLFELSVGVLVNVGDEPAEAWWVPATAYALYVITISYALRPVEGEDEESVFEIEG